MALIACPDCSKQVSDTAPACPNCGKPIAPVQIEQTRKSFKLVMVIGILFALIGFFLGPVAKGMVPTALLLFGILLFIGSIVAAWWNHG